MRYLFRLNSNEGEPVKMSWAALKIRGTFECKVLHWTPKWETNHFKSKSVNDQLLIEELV